MKKAEYKTAAGTSIVAFIETETDNIADHNYKAPCHTFVVEVAGFGRLSSPKLEGGLFVERGTRTVNGKQIKIKIPATTEASELYAEYLTEVNRRIESMMKADREYRDGYNKTKAAMAE